MRDWQTYLRARDAELTAGQVSGAVKQLARLNLARIPREFKVELAALCHRAGMNAMGLRLLGPLVRAEKNMANLSATPAELTEYAGLLRRSGAIREALKLLQAVDARAVPRSLLYQTFCLFNLWRYDEALACLDRYLQFDLNPYALAVARVNRLAALVILGRTDDALALADVCVRTHAELAYHRLLGNSLELRAQIYVEQHDHARARLDLARAHELTERSGLVDSIFVQKLQAIMDAYDGHSVEPLRVFRQHALAHRHWESVREADLYILTHAFDPALYDYLYFGTPHSGYRQRLERKTGHACTRSSYLLGSPEAPRLDLASGALSAHEPLTPGGKIHRLLVTLLQDFYSPPNVGAAFSAIFPNEYFDINSSPKRVHQIMRRARRWAEAEKIPLAIHCRTGLYTLQVNGALSFDVPARLQNQDRNGFYLDSLKQQFGGARFSAQAVRRRLGLSPDQCKRLLRWAVHENLLEKRFAGPATEYRVLSHKDERAA